MSINRLLSVPLRWISRASAMFSFVVIPSSTRICIRRPDCGFLAACLSVGVPCMETGTASFADRVGDPVVFGRFSESNRIGSPSFFFCENIPIPAIPLEGGFFFASVLSVDILPSFLYSRQCRLLYAPSVYWHPQYMPITMLAG